MAAVATTPRRRGAPSLFGFSEDGPDWRCWRDTSPLDDSLVGRVELETKAQNLHKALDNPVVALYVRTYCERRFCSECVQFVQQVRDMKALADEKQAASAINHIADTFVRVGAEKEVNISSIARSKALLEAGQGSRVAFDQANSDVLKIILSDIWPGFLCSAEFDTLMSRKEMRLVGFENLNGVEISTSRSYRARQLARETTARGAQAARDLHPKVLKPFAERVSNRLKRLGEEGKNGQAAEEGNGTGETVQAAEEGGDEVPSPAAQRENVKGAEEGDGAGEVPAPVRG